MLLESYKKEIFKAEGAKGPDDCPPLDDDGKTKLSAYLSLFHLDL